MDGVSQASNDDRDRAVSPERLGDYPGAVSEEELMSPDPLAPARGVFWGIVLSVPLWGLLFGLLWIIFV